ncbi:hypothetical protein NW768_011685 [Fusarium equiseti]|uniref:Uncharacterized protein n=1 Tax=Fusarium equiseti TaxID=61235 RepID=A0ABQ8QX03_FUSEQ|nr:hypothetical protein NW768_011685 [Fusarium equiseti]
MTDTAPVVPSSFNQAHEKKSQNMVQGCFKRIHLATGVWPWEWLPSDFTPRPEDWNYNNAEAMASVVELVCLTGSLASLNDLRDFLVGLYHKRKQRNEPESYHTTALIADCHLAREWVSRTHQDPEHTRRSTRAVVRTFRTPPFDHGEENCADEAEFNISTKNIDQDLESIVHDIPVGFGEELLSSGNSLRVKESPAPELLQLNPRKRTRLALGPDDSLDTELQEAFSSPDLDTDFEMRRIESSHRITINRQISTVQERIISTELVRIMCLKEKEEKRCKLERIDEHQWQVIHDEAIRVHDLAAERLEKAEKFAEVILSAIVEYGEEGSRIHDVLGRSQEEVMEADKAKKATQGALKGLEDQLRRKEEERTEFRDRIATLQTVIDDYDRDTAHDEGRKQDLLIQLASLDILCSHNLHTVSVEKRGVLLSALHDVLEHVTIQE